MEIQQLQKISNRIDNYLKALELINTDNKECIEIKKHILEKIKLSFIAFYKEISNFDEEKIEDDKMKIFNYIKKSGKITKSKITYNLQKIGYSKHITKCLCELEESGLILKSKAGNKTYFEASK
jgi:hypothetical protein